MSGRSVCGLVPAKWKRGEDEDLDWGSDVDKRGVGGDEEGIEAEEA